MAELDAVISRVRRENEAVADLIRLTSAGGEYAAMVRGVLDLIETVAPSPLLCLSIQEGAEAGHYARARPGIDLRWADDAGQAIARAHETWIGTNGREARHADIPPAEGVPGFLSFPAWTRSGRVGALAVAAPEPLQLTRDEEQRLRRLAEVTILVLDHALLLDQVDRLETIDQLTGATNHRRLVEILDYELQRHRHTARSLGLLLLDVEGLGAINQCYGRRYGNHILQKLAVLIKEIVRPIDVVARSGLDEFAVLLPETGEEAAQGWLERLRDRLLTVEFAGGEVWLSAAVVQAAPDEVLTPERLLRRAEQALAAAKRQQRGWTAALDTRIPHGR
ncbi:MAG: diguanylate cyclase domain-containing protein [Chloroflexota bacterium]